MSWLDALSGLFKPDAAAAPADPWNYMLARQLASRGVDNPARQPAALLAAAQVVFPALTPAAGQEMLRQIEAAQHRAYDLGAAVNRQALTEAAAAQQLRQEFPQLTPDNLNQLLTQGLVNTR